MVTKHLVSGLNLLYPVFVYMYIELLNNGHKTHGKLS